MGNRVTNPLQFDRDLTQRSVNSHDLALGAVALPALPQVELQLLRALCVRVIGPDRRRWAAVEDGLDALDVVLRRGLAVGCREQVAEVVGELVRVDVGGCGCPSWGSVTFRGSGRLPLPWLRPQTRPQVRRSQKQVDGDAIAALCIGHYTTEESGIMS